MDAALCFSQLAAIILKAFVIVQACTSPWLVVVYIEMCGVEGYAKVSLIEDSDLILLAVDLR